MDKLGELSDEQLLARLRAHVGKGHVWQAGLIAYLAEVEDRRLHLEHACSSMWDFCVRKLGMSESESQRRLAAARVVQQFPCALGYLERGEIHLCAVYALRDHLTQENHEELLREASGKSTRAVEAMIAARFPKPDVPPRIEHVEPQAPLPVVTAGTQPTSSVRSPATEPRPKVEPLSATRYRVELTVSAEVKAKLERIKDLMRHRNPTGDLETILDASLDLLRAKLEKERLGKTSRLKKAQAKTDAPEAPAHADTKAETAEAPEHPKKTARPGYISRETRREVFARDGAQCTFLDADGDRCPARAYLELDHVHPKALGGSDGAGNLRVRCRAHNRLYAEHVFGRAHVEERIHLRRRKYGAAPPPFESAANALRSMGFREPEVRRALATIETKLDAKATSIETIVREGLLVLT
jgi:5-methylcytosine-specific restriction endonuclease McrA